MMPPSPATSDEPALAPVAPAPPGGGPPAPASSASPLTRGLGTAALWRECLLQIRLSLPISVAYLLGFALQLTSQIIVGHISASALAASSLATVYGNASGMAVIIGLTSACETLASQAFGAGNLPRVGAVAQRASAVMLAVCVPCGAAWLFAGPALRLMGQDEATVLLAAGCIRLQLPGLPAVAVYEVLKRALQSVGVSGPQVVIGVVAVVFNAVLGVALVYGTPLGFFGAPLALSVSQTLMLALALLYIRGHRRIHAVTNAWRAAWRRITGGGGKGNNGGSERDGASLAAAAAAAAVDLRPLDGGTAAALAAPEAERDLDDVLDECFSLPLSAQTALAGWREYLLLGIPSAVLLIVEWGSFEVGALIAGLISTDALAAHAHGVTP